jgi:putative heme-binding domain-containing protein
MKSHEQSCRISSRACRPLSLVQPTLLTTCRRGFYNFVDVPSPPDKGEKVADRPDEGAIRCSRRSKMLNGVAVTGDATRTIAVIALFLWILATLPLSAFADPPHADSEKREPWTTSRIFGSPEPPLPYITERVFPALKFNQCLDITTAPGSDRLFVVEQAGRIFSFVNQHHVSEPDLAVDLAREIPDVKQVYALAFHPDFEVNRYCYICYIAADSLDDGSHVARFQVSDTDPPTIDAASETTVITWRSGGHNGCCLKFGPDGYLYISTGDAGPANPPDIYKTGQDISDLLSSILRIDVDQTDGEKNYRIPPDNPFVNTEGARGEVWAYGLRNPWRMSFDRKTGDLWVGDVGWELWEMLDRIERGGNYGWAVMEGRASTHPEWPRGVTPYLSPTIDHPHSESSSITEGMTYYGTRLPELNGTHIYGDYDTGKMWGFRLIDGKIAEHREIADTTHRIVGFGEDNDGELLLLDHTAGTIHRLLPNPELGQSSTFPRRLSDSGLFSSISDLSPASGVVPYAINAEPWSDFAMSERLVAVPNELTISGEAQPWVFPENSVLVKTLSLELHTGDPASRRLVETQILHFNGKEWLPYTYQWNDDQSDALLVSAEGGERNFEIVDSNAPGGRRSQTWRFSGRAECQRCHNTWSGPPLAFNALQLTHSDARAGTTPSQHAKLASTGLINPAGDTAKLQALEDPHDAAATLDDRARSYLHVNCSHCHRMHAGGAVLSHMHFDLPLDRTNMLKARPTQGTFGIHAAEVIAPGDPFRSVLLYRMAKLGNGRMPHIGSTEVDAAGLALLHEWLKQLPDTSDAETTAGKSVVSIRTDETAALARLSSAESFADQAEIVAHLLASTTGAMQLLHRIDNRQLPTSVSDLAIKNATTHSEVSVRDLFERFLPPEERIKRLGSLVRPEQVLSLTGDAARGRQVFFETSGVSCKNCHRIAQEGKEVGPELTAVGKKLNRFQLLESILEPSKQIDPKFVTYLAETKDGKLFTGLLLEKADHEVVLKDALNNQHRLATGDIEQLVPQRQSLMPDLLVRDMTAQQVADLLEYLSSLK